MLRLIKKATLSRGSLSVELVNKGQLSAVVYVSSVTLSKELW